MPARRPLVLIDLDQSDIATIRDRLLEVSARELLSRADLAALCSVSPWDVKHFMSVEQRVSDETLRCIIAAIPEVASGLPVEIRPR